jgi:Phosphate-starvation-inducible E family
VTDARHDDRAVAVPRDASAMGAQSGAAAGRDAGSKAEEGARDRIARILTRIEDLVYIGLAGLLAGSAVVLLAYGVVDFVQALVGGTLPGRVIPLLDRILLILMIVEIQYTVQVSFREHTLVPEPFLIIGLIAATRRILVLTAEFAGLLEKGEVAFRNAMIELALLTGMVLVLVASLLMLRKRPPDAVADRA